MRTQALGRDGETLAVRYLQDLGMTVIERNWRCRAGEVDIIAICDDELVICEVKTRVDDKFGGPLVAVTAAKLQRLRLLAGVWLDEHPLAVSGIRIDVIAITRPPRGISRIEHVRGVE